MIEPKHNPLCGSDGLCADCIASKTAPVAVEEDVDLEQLMIDFGGNE
jgi:hypothetical protein